MEKHGGEKLTLNWHVNIAINKGSRPSKENDVDITLKTVSPMQDFIKLINEIISFTYGDVLTNYIVNCAWQSIDNN